MSTVRATTLQKKYGNPTFVAVASEIPKDKLENVITIHHAEEDNRADYGMTGINQMNSVGYLIFPDKVPDMGETVITGINRIF